MRLQITAFGIARDIMGSSRMELEVAETMTISGLKEELDRLYPAFQGLRHYYIAVNEEYASESAMLEPSDKIVIIPPVSGG